MKAVGVIAEGKEVLHTKQTLKEKNGGFFPAEITLTIHRIERDMVRVTAIVRNIAERKQAEKEHQDYQQRLKALAVSVCSVFRNGWPIWAAL